MTNDELEEILEKRMQAYNLLGELALSGRLKRSMYPQNTDEDIILVNPMIDIIRLIDYIRELKDILPISIKVDKKFPKNEEKVLVWINGKEDPTVLTFKQVNNGYYGFYTAENVLIDGVTHWQTLPKVKKDHND